MNQTESIRALVSQGLPTTEIAGRLGVSKGTVAAVRAHVTMGTYAANRGAASGIYLRRDGELIPLLEQPYETEDVLQVLVAEHPGLLAGAEVADTPRRWVLLDREVSVSDQEGSSGRWSLDHLFVDQDGIPTLVEVKRSSDTRIRREVVGQLLEYAANGSRYWPIEQLRSLFDAGCARRGVSSTEELQAVLEDGVDLDAWWGRVETNLKLGRLRLVFVADAIGSELRRIIEFLNEQMTQTEVLGIEIRQYVDQSGQHQTLVPRLIGKTEAARDVKTGRPSASKRLWDQDTWLMEFERSQTPEELQMVHRLLEWAADSGVTLHYGSGATVAGMRFTLPAGSAEVAPFSLWPNGSVEIAMKPMVDRPWPPFDDLRMRTELRERLERIPGVSIAEERLDKWPTFPTSLLVPEASLNLFTQTWDWAFERMRHAMSTTAR